MTFETEYQLEEFRHVQPQYFDPDGEPFTNVTPGFILEKMLKLINQMEDEIKSLEKVTSGNV